MKRYIAMRRWLLSLMAVATALFFITGSATAAGTKTTSIDERRLTSEIATLEQNVSLPEGERVLVDTMSEELGITYDQIKMLQDKQLGYGEISAIYAFARKMPGGVTDENVNNVTSLREDKTGWGEVASKLNVELTDVANKLDEIDRETHSDIMKLAAEMEQRGAGGTEDYYGEGHGLGAGGSSPDTRGSAGVGLDDEIHRGPEVGD